MRTSRCRYCSYSLDDPFKRTLGVFLNLFLKNDTGENIKALTPYLFFDGNCREAMSFYKDCFDGELDLMTHENAPPESCAESSMDKNKVMHSCLQAGELTIMASDGMNLKNGSNIQLNIDCEPREQTEEFFNKLSEKGQVVAPLEDTFWGDRFGVVVDQFGTSWILTFPFNK